MTHSRRNTKRFRVEQNDTGRRFDRVVRRLFPEIGLSRLYGCIRRGDFRLNDRRVQAATRVGFGDEISVKIQIDAGLTISPPTPPVREIRGLILFENEHVLALNKPVGMPVHGRGSLDELAKHYLTARTTRSLSFQPGPVHRLDRNTSGLVLFATSLFGAQELSAALHANRLRKYYLALLDGEIRTKQRWCDCFQRDRSAKVTRPSNDSDAKTCVTEVLPIAWDRHVTFALCQPITGRTHQIRAQCALHGHALPGDLKYGGSRLLQSFLLHAACIRPEGLGELLQMRTICAPLPATARDTLAALLGPEAFGAGIALLNRLVS